MGDEPIPQVPPDRTAPAATASGPAGGDPPASPRPGPRRAAALALGIAAALLLLAVASAWLFRTRPPAAPSITPPAGPSGASRAGRPVGAGGLSPGPGSVVPVGAIIFRWTQVPNTVRYEIAVESADGRPLFRFTVPGAEYSARWPKDQPRPRPGHFLWRIQAFAKDHVIATSRTIPFQAR